MIASDRVRFVVHEELDHGVLVAPLCWNGNRNWDGRPTAANLAKKIAAFEASTQPGGCNEHLGPTRVLRAWIEDTFTGKTKATYEGVKV